MLKAFWDCSLQLKKEYKIDSIKKEHLEYALVCE